MATIRIDSDNLLNLLEDANMRKKVRLRMWAQERVKIFENYAKRNRPWRDQTAHARQRLKGYYEEHGNKIRLCIAHGVDYGASLEYGHERKYAILEPTIKAKGPDALKSLKVVLREIFGRG